MSTDNYRDKTPAQETPDSFDLTKCPSYRAWQARQDDKDMKTIKQDLDEVYYENFE